MNYYYGQNPQPHLPPPNYHKPPNPWLKPVRRNATAVCVSLMLALLLGIVLSPVFSEIEHFFSTGLEIKSPRTLSLLERLRDLAVYLLMFLIPLVVMRWWIGIPSRAAFPMKKPRASLLFPAILFCFGASVIGMFSATAVSSFFDLFFGLQSQYYPTSDPIGWPATIVYIFHVTVVAAVVEELIFRGVIMQSLRRFGDTFALVCSSALFGLTHHNLQQSVLTFVIGLAIGFFVLRTGSLKTGMLIHFVYNSAATIIDFTTRDLPERAAGNASMLVISVYIVAGLIGFALLQLFHGGSFRLARSEYPVAESRKYSLFFLSPSAIVYMLFIVIVICLQFS